MRLLGAIVWFVVLCATAHAKGPTPLLPVPGREVATDVEVRDGFIEVRFGFRVRGSAKRLWKIVRDFRRYPRYVEGLKKVAVRRKGATTRVSLRGSLLDEYLIVATVRTSYRKGVGVVTWTVPGEDPPSTGRMRVEPDGEEAVFSLWARSKKQIDLPDFLVAAALRAAIGVVATNIRQAIERGR